MASSNIEIIIIKMLAEIGGFPVFEKPKRKRFLGIF